VGGWAKLLNWLSHAFRFWNPGALEFVLSLLVSHPQKPFKADRATHAVGMADAYGTACLTCIVLARRHCNNSMVGIAHKSVGRGRPDSTPSPC